MQRRHPDHPARTLRGTDLRYALTWFLHREGPHTVAQLADSLAEYGLGISGRPSKTISDALRWEIAHKRVRRVERGLYAANEMPRGTERRIGLRVTAMLRPSSSPPSFDV